MTFSEATGLKPYRYQRPLHGEYGALSFIGPDRVVCHQCGRDFLLLGPHIWRIHGLTASEYRELNGLTWDTPLAGRRSRALKREINHRFGSSKNLEPHNMRGMTQSPERRLVSLRSVSKASRVSAERRRAGLSKQYVPATHRGMLAAARFAVAAWRSNSTELERAMTELAAIVDRKGTFRGGTIA